MVNKTGDVYTFSIDKSNIFQDILSAGAWINDKLSSWIIKTGLNNEQANVALVIAYMLIVIALIKIQNDAIKPIIKIIVAILVIYLILSFFT